MIEQFIKILKNPVTEGVLRINNNTLIDDKTNESFAIENKTVILLPKSEIKSKTSHFHKKSDTEFNYHDHYQKDAEIFNYFDNKIDKATKHENRRLHEVIYSKIKKKSEYNLDVGCGEAWIAGKLIPEGKKVISMDISSTNPKEAVQRNPSENHLGLVADAFNMPIQSNSIDTIIASEIMEHVPDPKLFVKSLFTCLKPGGKLIITTPYNEKLEINLCIHCNKPTPKNAHIHSFNEKNTIKLIPENCEWNISKFSNFYLTRLQLHPILSVLPHKLWKAIDRTTNSIFRRPSRLCIEITKQINH